MRRALSIIGVAAAISAAVAPASSATSADEMAPKTPAEIADCVAANSTIPWDVIVDRVPVSRPDTPQVEFQLECGYKETAGARHIHAGHAIKNAVTFQRCYSTALLKGRKIPQQYSSLYVYQPPGGPEVNVATDDFSPFVLSAFTSGPNSADWDGCSAHIPAS